MLQPKTLWQQISEVTPSFWTNLYFSLTVLHDQRSISDFEEAAKESAVIILRCGNISHIFTEIVGFVCKSYLTVLGYLFLSTL